MVGVLNFLKYINNSESLNKGIMTDGVWICDLEDFLRFSSQFSP